MNKTEHKARALGKEKACIFDNKFLSLQRGHGKTSHRWTPSLSCYAHPSIYSPYSHQLYSHLWGFFLWPAYTCKICCKIYFFWRASMGVGCGLQMKPGSLNLLIFSSLLFWRTNECMWPLHESLICSQVTYADKICRSVHCVLPTPKCANAGGYKHHTQGDVYSPSSRIFQALPTVN